MPRPIVAFALALVLALPICRPAVAFDTVFGGKLLLTRGISTFEGAGGGGLSSWALITGNETELGTGGSAHATAVFLPDYRLLAYGAAIGFADRVEVSISRQEFDTQDVGAALGLGRNFKFKQDILGLKIRLIGDAVYDQHRLLPQIAVGLQYKSNERDAIVRAVGATDSEDYDLYLAATKLLIDKSLLLNATVRATRANQAGLLGFGGDREDDRTLQVELSGAYLLSRRFALGAEYRSKPDNLGFAREDDAYDLFAAYAVNPHVTVTAAWLDLGDIATITDQHGLFLSLQVAF